MLLPKQQSCPLKFDLIWGKVEVKDFLPITDGGTSSHLAKTFQSYDVSKDGDLGRWSKSPQMYQF